MPYYDYKCLDCQKEFEVLRPIKEEDRVKQCPSCKMFHVERIYAPFWNDSKGWANGRFNEAVDETFYSRRAQEKYYRDHKLAEDTWARTV